MENKLDEELKEITKYNICDDLRLNKLNILAFVNLICSVIDTKEKIEELETIIESSNDDSNVKTLKTASAYGFLIQQKYYTEIKLLDETVGLSNFWIHKLRILEQQIKANDEKFNSLLERL